MAVPTELSFMTFIAAMHVVMFFAGANGIIVDENPDNPNEAFIEDITDDELTENPINESAETGIIADRFSIWFVIKDFVGTLISIITAPYALVDAAALPEFFELMFKTIMSVVQVWVVFRLISYIG